MSSDDTDSVADSDVDSEEEGSTFMHRLEMIRDLIEAPDEAIEALYDQYGKSMVYTAGFCSGLPTGWSLAALSARRRLENSPIRTVRFFPIMLQVPSEHIHTLTELEI